MTSPAPLTQHHADLPPALELLAADTGASLAYTGALGWHLVPDPALLRAVGVLEATEAPELSPPPVTKTRLCPHPTHLHSPTWRHGSRPSTSTSSASRATPTRRSNG